MSKHFITFGNKRFEKAARRICQQAKSINFFDKVEAYNENELQNNKEWWSKHYDFIKKNGRGYGLWIWKPFVIRDYMNKMEENDILLYADAGCEINKFGIDKLKEFFALADEHGVCAFQMIYKEKNFNKPELFNYLGVQNNEKVTETGQLIGGIIYIKKTPQNIKLLDEWIDLCSHDNYKFLSAPAKSNHRNDQSIFSVLMKRDGRFYMKGDLTFFNNRPEGREYPVHAMRNPGSGSRLKYK